MPEKLEKIFFSTSGSEANEAAIKTVHMYLATKGKYKIISRYHSYHGSTAASISVTGDPRRWFAEPNNKIPGAIFAPDAYCYRCPFHMEYPTCGIMCAEYVDYMIKNEANVAAIIVEPVVGTNGVLVPPKEYLPRLREIATENSVLFVADEVMSSWFRTGEWFAVNHWNVKPDIITTAKGCTGAYTPLGVTATTKEIAEYFEENYFAHGHTYEAHPLALAPVPAAVKEYKKLAASGHIRKVSDYLGNRLYELKDVHKSVGDVRGLGLLRAVEIVKNRKTKKPFNTSTDKAAAKSLTVDKITEEIMKKGVYTMGWISHIIVAPPLIITEEQIDEGICALDEALKIADQEVENE
jgi:taurine--2-oxoglutarate transaminase